MHEPFAHRNDGTREETPTRRLERDIDGLLSDWESFRHFPGLDKDTLSSMIEQIPQSDEDRAFAALSSVEKYRQLFCGNVGGLLERVLTRASNTSKRTEFAPTIWRAMRLVDKPDLLTKFLGPKKTDGAAYAPSGEQIHVYSHSNPRREDIILNLAQLGGSDTLRNLYHEGIHASQFENLHQTTIDQPDMVVDPLWLIVSLLEPVTRHLPGMAKTNRYLKRLKNIQAVDIIAIEAQTFVAHSWTKPLTTTKFVQIFDGHYFKKYAQELQASPDRLERLIQARRLVKLLGGVGVEEDAIAHAVGGAQWDSQRETYPALQSLVDSEAARQGFEEEDFDQLILLHTLSQYVFTQKLRVIAMEEIAKAVKQ